MQENELEKAFQTKFYCSSKFTKDIEHLVQVTPGMRYIDAIVEYCETNTIDLESVPKLISKPLKEKLRHEAMELNFLKKTSRAKLVF
jgi:hypothetical protein